MGLMMEIVVLSVCLVTQSSLNLLSKIKVMGRSLNEMSVKIKCYKDRELPYFWIVECDGTTHEFSTFGAACNYINLILRKITSKKL